ncbi:hypothetical protein BJY21_001024 [Kineosphaera limosa]|uniref:Uncharacterized protein n=1 Tax=Kineosphaera limosa NBRC 100340 TaxID=1184609 RepID=K6WUH5_9MICO|nr:hypothetical protein [Kineosphaera limosa]NYD99839.1 hypothetical protein [Kineosphaera limosa]GAB97486.1 hypothetical protein KILIM_070_00230 [Kineosphaera limosa NBRC 100340]
MSVAKWEQALMAMEDELDVHEAQVRTGEATMVPAWEAPGDLGPLPPQLAERVMSLVRRIGLLSTFVQFQLVAAESDLKHLEHRTESRGTGNRAVALFLDASV